MKEWVLRIAIAAIFTATSTVFTIWYQSPSVQPSPAYQKVVESLNDSSQWTRHMSVTDEVALINKDLTVKVTPGKWYATVYTRKKKLNDKDVITVSDFEWKKVQHISKTDSCLINNAFYQTAKQLEDAELNQ